MKYQKDEFSNRMIQAFEEVSAQPVELAFIPFSLEALYLPVQSAQIVEIYRVAAERTQRQLKVPAPRIPAFSVN